MSRAATPVYEYVSLKEFARRRGVTVNTAREMAHSKELYKFVRQEGKGHGIFFNWTLFQEYFETKKFLVG